MNPEGSFQANGEWSQRLKWARPHPGEIAYDTGAGANTGVIRSSSFQLPASIHLYSCGFMSHPGMRLYLIDEATRHTLDLRQRNDPAFEWKLHVWPIPSDWRGKTVRLVAEDNGRGDQDWMGITAPKAGGEAVSLSLLRAGGYAGALALLAILFLLPGVATALAISRNRDLDFISLVAAVLCGSGAASYLAFWVYLASPTAGRLSSILAIAGGAIFVALNHKQLRRLPALRESAACVGFAILVSVFYSCLGFLYITDDGAGEQAEVRYNLGMMPSDNLLPITLAERLYTGRSPKPTLSGLWHSSDRPPIQAGADLLMFPLLSVRLMLTQQLLGVFLQSFSLIGLWALIRAGNLGNRYLVPILAFAVFSEVCSFHSFYIWPKLMAAGYVLLGMALVFRAQATPWINIDVALASACLSLGLLSHPSVAFTIIPLAIAAVVTRRVPGVKKLVAGLAIALLFLLPWRWYQTVYDPPGDYLLKFNMTSVPYQAAALSRPFGALLAESYAHLSVSAYLETKAADLDAILGVSDLPKLLSTDWRKDLAAFETGSFVHLFWALGFLNLAFFFRFFARPSAALRFSDQCLWIVLGSVPIWIFVLYQPGATIIHEWSLANVLILFLVLMIYLIEKAQQLVYPLLALQAICIFPLLILGKRSVEAFPVAVFDAPLDPGMAALAMATLLGIAYLGWRAKFQR